MYYRHFYIVHGSGFVPYPIKQRNTRNVRRAKIQGGTDGTLTRYAMYGTRAFSNVRDCRDRSDYESADGDKS